MSFWSEIKQRRITQIVVTYLAGGWIATSVIDQVVDREVLPLVVYEVTLTLFLFGILGALIIGWYHGEKGAQKAQPVEIAMLVVVGASALGSSGLVIRNALSETVVVEGADPARVAVLYFEDLSDGELAPVADGITEALIDQLDEVRSLDVVSRNGVLPYRDSGLRSDSIARVLEAGTVIEGSVEGRGDQIRITTRLVDGLSGADLQRSITEIPAGEFLVARDSVAESVSRLLRERLGEEVQLRELRASTENPEAWALVQRAERLRSDAERLFQEGRDVEGSLAAYQEADGVLESAESLDPEWVRPITERGHAAYRQAWLSMALGDIDTVVEKIDEALGHLERALELDPDNAPAFAERGRVRLFQATALAPSPDEVDQLLEGAQEDLEAAVANDPSFAEAHADLSFLYVGLADPVNAVLSARRALEEDAYLQRADLIYDRLSSTQYELEQFRDSERWCDEGRSRFPDNYRFATCRLWLMAAPHGEPDVDAAWEELARVDSLTPESLRPLKHSEGEILVAGVLRRASLADSAESVLSRVNMSESVDPQRQLFVYEAAIRATTGDPDGAVDALRRWAAATPGSTLGPGGELNWWWRELRTREDFQPFVSR